MRSQLPQSRPASLLGTLACACALALAGCSGGGGSDPVKPVTIVLDWTPNPAHAGILLAQHEGLDRMNGVSLRLRTPSSSADGIRLMLAGQADLAILDIHDVAIAAERGRELRCPISIVARPLAALIASGRIKSPGDLAGGTVAVTGAPADRAVTGSIVAGDGGDPASVRLQPSGFAATQALLSGRVDAAVGFWTEEGVTLSRLGRGFHSFKVDSYGAPTYPELVLCGIGGKEAPVSPGERGAVSAISKGTAAAIANPNAALEAVAAKLPGANRELLKARLAAVLGALNPVSGKPGSLDLASLRRWARWEASHRLVKSPPDVDAIFGAGKRSG